MNLCHRDVTADRDMSPVFVHADYGYRPCSFTPEVWGEVPGIDGPVLLCNTHGHPGDGGVYLAEPGTATGTCDGYMGVTPTVAGIPEAPEDQAARLRIALDEVRALACQFNYADPLTSLAELDDILTRAGNS